MKADRDRLKMGVFFNVRFRSIVTCLSVFGTANIYEDILSQDILAYGSQKEDAVQK